MDVVPAVVQPEKVPVSNPPLVIPPVAAGLTVHVNEVVPDAVPEEAVTTMDEVPVADGVPLIRPEELIDSPAGRPVAENVRGLLCESVAEIWSETAVPTLPVWLPGFVTVTVSAAAGLTVQPNEAVWVVGFGSVTVTVAVPVPVVVGVPEI